MPVHPVRRDGKIVGYQYGDTGKVYPVSDGGKAEAAKKAGQQGAAIEHSQDKE